MFSVPLDQLKLAFVNTSTENTGEKWLRTTSTLVISSTVFYPLWRGWMAFVSQFEYIRQDTGQLKTPWMQRRYRMVGEALSKAVQADGIFSWYRGLGPFLCMAPILTFVGINRSMVKRQYPKDNSLGNSIARDVIAASAALTAEFLCFPFRYAYVLMASEPFGLPKPRPTARQIMSDLFKYGGSNKALWLSFAPGALASILATLPSRSENSAFGVLLVSYMLNLVSIRLIVASIPGAPRPYASIMESVRVHFTSSMRTWFVGVFAFMIPFISIAMMRTQLDGLYFVRVKGITPPPRRPKDERSKR